MLRYNAAPLLLTALLISLSAGCTDDRAATRPDPDPVTEPTAASGSAAAAAPAEEAPVEPREPAELAEEEDEEEEEIEVEKEREVARDTPPPRPYPLDEVERRRNPREKGCPDVELVRYRGQHVRLGRAVRVNPHFRDQLTAFERVAAEVGREVYGRAPSRIDNGAVYSCRSVRGKPWKMSEHALGNGIDIFGFQFPALPRSERAGKGRLGRSFTVSVKRHWYDDDEEGLEALHAEFLHRLVVQLHNERVFRIMLGPGFRGHRNVLHVDYGLWFFVSMDLPIDHQQDFESDAYWPPDLLRRWREMRRRIWKE